MYTQPLSKVSSIQERIREARFMENINRFYLNALNKDLDDLENIEIDVSYALRGILLAYQNDHKSIEYWNKAIELNPNADHFYNFGLCCQYLGFHKKALKHFRKAFELSEKNISLLRKLRSVFSTIYAYEECQKSIELINKLDHLNNEVFVEDTMFKEFFNGNKKLVLDLGLKIADIISKHFSFKWISHTEDGFIEDRYYSIHKVKCNNEKDILNLVNCNTAISDFIVDFEEEHQLDLSQFYVCCEAVE